MPGVALTICSLLIAPLKATTVLFRNIPCKSLSGPSDNIEIPLRCCQKDHIACGYLRRQPIGNNRSAAVITAIPFIGDRYPKP